MDQKRMAKVLVPMIYSLFFFLFVSGCLNISDPYSFEAISISDPSSISKGLKQEVIFLSKNVNDENVISITSLDFQTKDKKILVRECNGVELSPDGKFVTYVSGEIINGDFRDALWLYDLDKQTEVKIAGWDKKFTEIALSNPSFSPDGNKIIFSVTWFETDIVGLATVNIDGSNQKILKTNLPLNEGPIYSPDGTLIMVTCAGLDDVSKQPGFQLCLLEKNGLFQKQLTNRGDAHGFRSFTPDGKRIVFSEFEFGGPLGIINKPEDRFFIMDIDGENKTLLLDWEVGVRGFSADGKEIIFEGRRDEKSPWGIYIINIDGTNLRHLTYFDEFLEEWYADIEQY